MNNIKEKKYLKAVKIIITIILLSASIMTVTFVFSSPVLNEMLFDSYFKSAGLIFMNILPIFLFISLIYVISNKLWLGFLLANLLFTVSSIVNKFKLTYRDDPFTFMDIKLINESFAMTKRYEIKFTPNIVWFLIGAIIITILLKRFFKTKINSKRLRISFTLAILIVGIISFQNLYLSESLYKKLGDDSLVNIWSEPQVFQSKGFVYPFIHSVKDSKETVLEGYDEEKAIKDLGEYEYSNIPKDQKVNVVGIMLEAYNDFSKFDTIEIDDSVYEDFHEVQKESLHGNMVTNVFAGGTINTERGFITGYQNHPKYLRQTNSFAWYFKEQGYRTKAMHPIYGWFYNRRNINTFLGFDSFDYYENKYQAEREEFFDDNEFFDYVIEDYEKARDDGKPYLNYSTTYQNHGPYSDEKLIEEEYLKRKQDYNDKDYNIINNYLAGVKETSHAIKKLTSYFEDEEEPVIVVMFGDHNPWLGKKSTGYDMMDINIDVSTEEGFVNYYQTPYIVWANTAAKETLGKDFAEQGEDVSPNFLMPKIFEYIGWQGNEYMQYLIDLSKTIDVNHTVFFKEDGEYTKRLSKDNKELYKDFINVQHYYNKNFIDNKEK